MLSSTDWSLRLQLLDRVQGAGFRPMVYRLAQRLELGGWIANSSRGLQIELIGPRLALEQALQQLRDGPPPQSRIDQWHQRWEPLNAATDLDPQDSSRPFRIHPSLEDGANGALISPDLALCEDCRLELADPSSRRFRYPFISCTACGPRYSLLEAVPFEREHTSLAAFPPCPSCASEYANPEDRRFHAQTISCPDCGPQLRWNQQPTALEPSLRAAVALLRTGGVVALKGIGGFQLLVDPTQPQALETLRHRKGRPDKPLALLSTADALPAICHCSAEEAQLWHSPAAPIMLLRRRAGAPIAEGVAGASPWLGVMRPASALQQLLLEAFGRPLVATSANRSGEPILADGERDAPSLAVLADGVLSHQLPIVNRIDDSVVRWAAGGPLVLRLGRGLAPLALPQAEPSAGALAVGAQVKGALALHQAHHLVLSPDLGDLSSCAGGEHFERTAAAWIARQGEAIRAIAADLHPGYRARAYAEQLSGEQASRRLDVQHHHAHLLAVMAEHALKGPALGLAWDGSGLGEDGSLWGGEALLLEGEGFCRQASLRPFGLPGGERALREPRRAALGLLLEAYGAQWRERLRQVPELPWRQAFTEAELEVLEQSLLRGLHRNRCSSIGRLFDGVAALLGLRQVCSFEAQAALALEALATEALEAGAAPDPYRLPLERRGPGEPWQWNWEPLLEALLIDREQGRPAAEAALAFHHALAQGAVDLAFALGQRRLLLAGGCFQNKLLLELTVAALEAVGVQPLWCQQLPCNDASLPVGQLLALGASTASFNDSAYNQSNAAGKTCA